MQNHFDLFGLPATFDVDLAALDAAYREVQGRVHPDRFVNATGAAPSTDPVTSTASSSPIALRAGRWRLPSPTGSPSTSHR